MSGVVQAKRSYDRGMLLNLGHTFGHAIETAQGYGGLLHGEAVAVGMATTTRVSSGRRLRSRLLGMWVDPYFSEHPHTEMMRSSGVAVTIPSAWL